MECWRPERDKGGRHREFQVHEMEENDEVVGGLQRPEAERQ